MTDNAASELDAMRAGLEALKGLDQDARARAIDWIAGALGVKSPASQPPARSAVGPGPTAAISDLGTPKQFVTVKAAESDVERVTVLAYYLTHARGIGHFKTKDLNDLNLEAAAPKLSNASYAASNATKKSGYFAAGPAGTKQITSRGEALVEALPDRDAAKAAVDAIPGKPRRSRVGKPRDPHRESTGAHMTTSLSKDAVQAILTDAIAVIDAASVEGDLRSVAFGKAIDLLSGATASRPHERIPSLDEQVAHEQLPGGDERLTRIAKRMGVNPASLAYVYELDDEGVTLVIPRSRLGADKSSASQEVALLYSAARQAGGYDVAHTPGAEIRVRAGDMGVLDGNNFAASLSAMTDVFVMKGTGAKREVKVTQHGYEEAAKLVSRITDKG